MNDHFIFVNLMGGMGNQLFQYAAGLLQKQVTNGTLILCKPHTNIHDTQDYRISLFSQENKYDGILPSYKTLYQENGYASWNPDEWKDEIVLLYGYFQHYPTLKHILPSLKEIILQSLSDTRRTMKYKYNVVTPSIFIHIRRGDYLNIDTISHLQSLEFHKKAYALLSIHKKQKTFNTYIFSDDIEWCKTQDFFKQINPIWVNEQDPINALALMCEIKDGAIIANSTFSWMGAYFGCGLKENTVFCPEKWDTQKVVELYPEEWIRI